MNLSMNAPGGPFQMHGDSIHTSDGNAPHLSGSYAGVGVHIPYVGQTTLGMYDRSLGAHRLGEVANLHDRFPDTFRDSGLKY